MSSKKAPDTSFILSALGDSLAKHGKVKEFSEFSGYHRGHISNVLGERKGYSPRFIDKATEWLETQKGVSGATWRPQDGDRPPGRGVSRPDLEKALRGAGIDSSTRETIGEIFAGLEDGIIQLLSCANIAKSDKLVNEATAASEVQGIYSDDGALRLARTIRGLPEASRREAESYVAYLVMRHERGEMEGDAATRGER